MSYFRADIRRPYEMNQQVFINLPVADLTKSRAFYQALGYDFNEQFSDDTAACVVISQHIHVMLLTHPKFRQFTPKAICDSTKFTEVLNCLSCSSREEVDQCVARAVSGGGSTYADAKDYGFMYQHSFQDPDGHQWELIHLSAMPPAKA
ncbi:MAG TPA: VOC family protein [Verrucomicrobiaceae bacterium]